MNIRLTLLLFFTVQISWAQKCDFEITTISNQLNGKSTLIEKSVYEKGVEISEEYIEFTPISEAKLVQNYPKIFKRKDSCYEFKTKIDDETCLIPSVFKACKNKVQTKEYLDYEFKGIYCGNALIEVSSYESWGFLSIDLISGIAFYTMGKPLTSNGITAISYSNYYTEEEVALTDLKTKKQYMISIEGWRTTASKVHKNVYYLKLVPTFLPDCKEEAKYLKVEIND
jgi:hypothetical protein